jgi:hypothetical protein
MKDKQHGITMKSNGQDIGWLPVAELADGKYEPQDGPYGLVDYAYDSIPQLENESEKDYSNRIETWVDEVLFEILNLLSKGQSGGSFMGIDWQPQSLQEYERAI